MKKNFTLLAILISSIGFGQDPEINSWMLNTNGTLATYEYYPGPPPNTTTVNMTDSADILQVCYDANYVYIRTNGLASYSMGPWPMNPNQPQAIESTYRFARNPAEETGTKVAQPYNGALGVAVNGVKMYGAGDDRSYNSSTGQNEPNGDGLWNSDAWVSEGATMDASGAGHPDQNGNYHYHAAPLALYDTPSSIHSPIIGYAFDGFPIYGPYGYSDSLNAGSSVVRMESSYQLRSMSDRSTLPDGSPSVPPGPAINSTFPLGTYWEDYEYVAGSGTLDEYNGRYCVTPDYPGGTYAYFITTDVAGDPVYPYVTGPEYYGVVNPAEIGGAAGNINIPAGVTCGQTASVNETELTVQLYPNPAQSSLYVTGVNSANYSIHDQSGRLVMTGILNEKIDISLLETGIYSIRIEKDNLFTQTRFIKE